MVFSQYFELPTTVQTEFCGGFPFGLINSPCSHFIEYICLVIRLRGSGGCACRLGLTSKHHCFEFTISGSYLYNKVWKVSVPTAING
jgi:hypothetical protein